VSSQVWQAVCPTTDRPTFVNVTTDPGTPDEWTYLTIQCLQGGTPQLGIYLVADIAGPKRLRMECSGTYIGAPANPAVGSCQNGLWNPIDIGDDSTGWTELTYADGSVIGVAILGCWAVAYGVRQVINLMRPRG